MSTRGDIVDTSKYWSESQLRNGLIYSEVLGWLDMGHARGDDIRKLMADFASGEASGKDFYDVRYEQKMGVNRIRTGRFIIWKIKSGRSVEQRKSIALSMMMNAGVVFENWQPMPWFSWYTDSGFSGEDLVSDLFGFYKVTSPKHYWNDLQIVSQESALRRWDHYGPIGSYKNSGFLPLLFPEPVKRFTCVRAPFKGNLPGFMTSVTPYKLTLDDDIVRPITRRVGVSFSIEEVTNE